MRVKIVFSAVAIILLALVQNSIAGCKDSNVFTVNSRSYNCETAFDDFGIDTVCGTDDLKDWCCKSCKPATVKGKKMKAEGLFVLDAKSIEIFTKEANGDKTKGKNQLKEDVEFAITDANAYYDTLEKYGLDITIYIAKLQILDYDLVSGKEIKKGDVVNEDVLIDNFEDWLQTNEAGLKDTKYDFAMLLSGYDIEDPTTGYATLARMCQRGKAFGVIEFRGLPDDASTLAHEIAHIFGASHDPKKYKTVMASSSGADITLDKYKFSDVSADAIMEYLTSTAKASDCLFQTRSNSKEPKISRSDYTGNSQDLNYLCERDIGKGSQPCLDPYFYDFGYDSDGVCREVYCHATDTKGGCWPMNPPEGLPCNKGKSCTKGKCKNDPRPELKDVDPKCPLGEDPMPSGQKGVSCADLIAKNGPGECNDYADECCETCPQYKTGIKGCEYGDLPSFKVNGEVYDCAKTIKDFGKQETCKRDEDFMGWCCGTCKDLGY